MPKFKNESKESPHDDMIDDEESAYNPEEDEDEPTSEDTGSVFKLEEEEEQNDDDSDNNNNEGFDSDAEDIIAVDSDSETEASMGAKKQSKSNESSQRKSCRPTATTTGSIKREQTKVPALKASSETRQHKKKEVVVDEEELNIPTSKRKTENGGYSHTARSRAKISAANSGNKPWNEGKNWSNSIRTKIALGVKARNRVILLEKLKRLNMTEAEWDDMKLKTKRIRERVRVITKRNASAKERVLTSDAKKRQVQLEHRDIQREAKEKTRQERLAVEAAKVPGRLTKKLARSAVAKRLADEAKEVHVPEIEWAPFQLNGESDTTATGNGDDETENTKETMADIVASRDIDDDDNHAEGNTNNSDCKNIEYEDTCPDGGPGGLICCETCCQKYSMLLGRTDEDLREHRFRKTARDIKHLMDILAKKHKDLEGAMKKARGNMTGIPINQSFEAHDAIGCSNTAQGNNSASIMTNPMDIEAETDYAV